MLFLIFTPLTAFACACGCGVFNVGTSALIPNCSGGTAFLQYDQINQTRNWGSDSKSDEHNHDHKIATSSLTAGAQYMFNREFGAAFRVPMIRRFTETLHHNHDGGSETIESKQHSIGDIRLNGIYAGFFDDMSTGITFGVKLPTGSTAQHNVPRNQQIGTGSTDSIIGAYHLGKFGEGKKFGYFAQASWQQPILNARSYNPGYELSAATGVYYDLGKISNIKKAAPILQLTGTRKAKDSGASTADHNLNSGYEMVFFAPGFEVAISDFKLYGDVEFPVYRRVNGVQLVPQNIYKMILGYNF